MMARPPELAEALLQLLLPVETRETTAGDLLEEYRDARLPALGRWRADLWYWRQVGGIWLRAYGWFLVPLMLSLVIHDIFNTFREPSGASYLDQLPKLALAPMSPFVGIGLFVVAGAYGSWRTQRWAGGFAATLGLSLVLWMFMAVWWMATWYPVAQVQQSNPYWIQAWHWSTARTKPSSFLGFVIETPDESFLRWIFWDNIGGLIMIGFTLLAVAMVCGGTGSALGRVMARRRPAGDA